MEKMEQIIQSFNMEIKAFYSIQWRKYVTHASELKMAEHFAEHLRQNVGTKNTVIFFANKY